MKKDYIARLVKEDQKRRMREAIRKAKQEKKRGRKR